MANEVKLKVGVDTSEIEKNFANLIKKLQGDADKLKLAPASKTAAPGVTSVREAAETNRNLNQKIREEKAGLDIINRELAKKKALIDQITRQQEAAIKGSREEVALAQRLNKEQEKLQQTQKIAQIQQTNYNKIQEATGKAMGSAGGKPTGGSASGTGAVGAIGGALGAMLFPASIAAAVFAGIKAGTKLESGRQYFAEAGQRATETEASAFNVQGQGGQRIQSLLNGGGAEEMAFNPLRVQAAKNAEERMKGRMESSFRIFTRPLQTLFGAANNGYEAGNQLGLGTANQKREISAQQQQERADEQAKQFEALKTGPEGALRTGLTNKYLSNYQRDLDFQRQMGLNTESFRGRLDVPTGQYTGGFKGDIQSAGFTDEQGMGMASSIMGAGGSTRSARGNAALGLQAQRNLDMTNAGSVLGKLSGGLGSSDTTKESFVKILAEGTRIGLDGSDFREENRKFVESAADVIAKSGTTTTGGVDQILSQFGRFFGDKTMAGQEAGKNAYELYRQTSMAQTGPTGTMTAAGMMTDPTINKLSTFSRASLFNMPIDQLTPDNPSIIAMAAEANTTPQKLIDAQNKITASSANKFNSSDSATKNLADVKKKYGVGSAIGFQGPLSQAGYSELDLALGKSNVMQGIEHPELAQSQRTASAYSDALSSGDSRKMQSALEDAKKQQLGAPGGGRPEDETNRVQAETSRLANQMFMSMKDSIVPASDAAKNLASDLNALTAAMRGATPAQAAKMFTDFNMSGTVPSAPPTAGSPPSGAGH